MQGKESSDNLHKINRKNRATTGDALIHITNIIESLGMEILKSETKTSLGKVNLFIALFVLMVFLVQSFITIFDATTYELMFAFCSLFILSVMMANRRLRSKEVAELSE